MEEAGRLIVEDGWSKMVAVSVAELDRTAWISGFWLDLVDMSLGSAGDSISAEELASI